MNGALYIGTCGFVYDGWIGHFYDEDLPAEWRFQHYTNQLRSILLPVDSLTDQSGSDITTLVEDSDKDFRMVLSVTADSLDETGLNRLLRFRDALGDRLVAMCLELDSKGSQITWRSAIETVSRADLGTVPWCVSPPSPLNFDTGQARFSRTWYPQLTGNPEDFGDFLVVRIPVLDLPAVTHVVERCQQWCGTDRSAGIFLEYSPEAALVAGQYRLLAEMMGC